MIVDKQQIWNLYHSKHIKYYLNRYKSYPHRSQEYLDYLIPHCEGIINNNIYIKQPQKLSWYQKYKIKTNKFKYAIILPTRHRVHILSHCLASIDENTKYKNRVVILLSADEDDTETISYIKNRKNRIRISFRTRKRTGNLVSYYNNRAVEISHTDDWFIFGLNDDAEILTKNWDQILNEIITEHRFTKPDGIDYIFSDVFDGRSIIEDFCPFPMVSSKSVKTLGFFLPPEIYTHGADIALYDIYKDLCVPSVVKAPIRINHNSCNDHTHGEMINTAYHNRCHLTETEISRYQEVLNRAIINNYESRWNN